jgi:hypothetical protein
LAPVQVSSSAPVTATQVPPPPVQAMQVPHEAAPQQRLSTQLPVAQSAPAVQLLPDLILQSPVALQVLPPAQVSRSSALMTATQLPLLPVQVWQLPQAAAPQQWPSTQWADEHSTSVLHSTPLAFFAWQAPAELQNWVEEQGAVVGSQPFAQRPPEQRLLPHGDPVPDLQWPAPSQTGAGVATPAWQLALPQNIVASANTVHAVRLLPSQLPLQADPSPAQAVRPVRGAPLTAMHRPLLVPSPQDSH